MMDDSGKPYLVLIIILIVLVIALAASLAAVIYTFRKNIRKRVKGLSKINHIPEDEVIEEEIISMVKEGHEQGVIQASEAKMIHNIFQFGETSAKDIMTHRKNIVAIDGTSSFYEVMTFLMETGKSRFPVYVEDIDNIIGILHIKDAFAFSQRQELFSQPLVDLPQMLRGVDFITETLNINTLFKRMQTSKNHICIVVDEYGQTSGLVAMEDILEEIVGDIEDEHDEEEKIYSVEADGSYTFDGLTELRDVLEVISIPVSDDEDFDTLNGYLISVLEKIPNDGACETVTIHGYDFEILEVKNRIIRKVRVKKSVETCRTEESMLQ